ncbi:MAG: nitroreductase [Myxococcales bacterium]|nr:nitroreductase [Myxococcales bacterium]
MLSVSEAIAQRISIRSFLPTEVPRDVVAEILDTARWAPSGGNMQPWRVIAVAGEARQAVIDLAERALAENPHGEADEFPIYPPKLWEPYRSRRYELGEAMYALMGIPREDKPARLAHLARNYRFFDAPVGLFFVIDRGMGYGQWAHVGMLMQSIALVALERGLGTCMQEAWGTVRKSLHAHFGLPEHEVIYCGMALGHPDWEQPVNQLRSERAPLDEIADFRGFDDSE